MKHDYAAPPPLFAHAAPHNGTPTSIAGARHIAPKVGPQSRAILAQIQYAGDRGVTRQDIAAATGIPLASVCGRVAELIRNRLAHEDGERKGAAGCPQAIVKAGPGAVHGLRGNQTYGGDRG